MEYAFKVYSSLLLFKNENDNPRLSTVNVNQKLDVCARWLQNQ